MIEEYEAARAAERVTFEAMTREQLVAACEGALAACRMADRQMEDYRRELAEKDAAILERDRSLRAWASAFAPNRPLNAMLP